MKTFLHAKLINYAYSISAFKIFQKKNMVIDGLSQVIFNNPNYFPNRLVSKLAKEVFLHQDNNKWFWKSGKRVYKDILMQFTTEDLAIWIQQYGKKAISDFFVR